ncbi:MAG: sulfotransferase [Dokdonella sp.]
MQPGEAMHRPQGRESDARSGVDDRSSRARTQRTFLVGCQRSGTTFLQAALSSHPRILSIPETAFFERALPGRIDDLVRRSLSGAAIDARQRGRDYLRVQRRVRRALRSVADELGVATGTLGLHFGLGGYVGEFAGLLDTAAHAGGCHAWLEKTPNHVFYLDVIERHLPQARFIHLLRRGEDVVASAVDASMRYAGYGDGRVFWRGVPWWVACWNAAVAAHVQHAGRANHCIVFYDDLLRNFAGEYARLCAFIGVEPVDARLGAHKRIADLGNEPWKNGALSGQLIPATPKFDALFGPDVRSWIRTQLSCYDEVREMLCGRIACGSER